MYVDGLSTRPCRLCLMRPTHVIRCLILHASIATSDRPLGIPGRHVVSWLSMSIASCGPAAPLAHKTKLHGQTAILLLCRIALAHSVIRTLLLVPL